MNERERERDFFLFHERGEKEGRNFECDVVFESNARETREVCITGGKRRGLMRFSRLRKVGEGRDCSWLANRGKYVL